jgi:LCP family protein required for cell wall assembly
MNLSRFIVTLTIIIGIFLFVVGSGVLYYINNVDLPVFYEEPDNDPNNGNNDDKPNPNTNPGLSDLLDKKQYPVNFLLFVGDYDQTNTDFIALVNYNPEKSEFSVLSIPRDTRVPGVAISFPKVNSLYARPNGQELAVKSIANMLKVNVKYFVYINLSTFRQVIDLLGGVDIDVPVDLKYDDPTQNLHINIPKGRHHMDGKMAEEYLRFRKPNNNEYTSELLKYYDGSDLSRIKVQQNFVKELIKQKANIVGFAKISQIVETIFDNVQTNATMSDVLNLAKGLPTISLDKINFFVLPGTAEADSIYYEMNEAKTAEIISEYFYSRGNVSFGEEDPTEQGAG